MRHLTLLYDCAELTPSAAAWIARAPKYIEVEPVRGDSAAAEERFPALPGRDAKDALIVVDDEGGVYRGAKAELMVLWALRRFRAYALKIGRPEALPFRRGNLNWLAGGAAR